jgi:hypothetical protein
MNRPTENRLVPYFLPPFLSHASTLVYNTTLVRLKESRLVPSFTRDVNLLYYSMMLFFVAHYVPDYERVQLTLAWNNIIRVQNLTHIARARATLAPYEKKWKTMTSYHSNRTCMKQSSVLFFVRTLLTPLSGPALVSPIQAWWNRMEQDTYLYLELNMLTQHVHLHVLQQLYVWIEIRQWIESIRRVPVSNEKNPFFTIHDVQFLLHVRTPYCDTNHVSTRRWNQTRVLLDEVHTLMRTQSIWLFYTYDQLYDILYKRVVPHDQLLPHVGFNQSWIHTLLEHVYGAEPFLQPNTRAIETTAFVHKLLTWILTASILLQYQQLPCRDTESEPVVPHPHTVHDYFSTLLPDLSEMIAYQNQHMCSAQEITQITILS